MVRGKDNAINATVAKTRQMNTCLMFHGMLLNLQGTQRFCVQAVLECSIVSNFQKCY